MRPLLLIAILLIANFSHAVSKSGSGELLVPTNQPFKIEFEVKNISSKTLTLSAKSIPNGCTTKNSNLVVPARHISKIELKCTLSAKGVFSKVAEFNSNFGKYSFSVKGSAISNFATERTNLGNFTLVKLIDSDEFFLEGKTCQDLFLEIKAFENLNSKINRTQKEAPSCVCSGIRCSTRITSLLPHLILKTNGKLAQKDGPNCWNSILVLNSIVPYLRYSDDSEIRSFLKSPLCKQRGIKERPQPGDVIAIRDSRGEEVHAFVYISEHISFSKNGFSSVAPYSLTSTQAVFDRYEVPEGCAFPNSIIKREKCEKHADYFSCVSLEEYMASHKNEFSKKYLSLNSRVEAVECKISQGAFGLPNSALDEKSLSDSLKLYLKTISKNPKSDQIWWETLKERVNSCEDQLEFNQSK